MRKRIVRRTYVPRTCRVKTVTVRPPVRITRKRVRTVRIHVRSR